ncbi:MAG: DEAD/DEAH box helicase [Planctomycetia bacterium]|nr:MAG: DEAD/DEAH box helicase [Planctomycetia bacterium]
MNRSDICSAFLGTLTHELYPYQEEALLAWFESDHGVMVCAPTGMGKTLLAEAAVYEALTARRRIYYTTPLIALTDQKFRELQALAVRWGFAAEDVGLITGNRRENPDALVRVVVAEILLNHLLSADAANEMASVDAVAMDEFHSFNDPERGVVWELSLLLLPPRVRVLLLSATVGNPDEFAAWLRERHGRPLTVITTAQRRVPLEYTWVEDRLLTEHLPEMVSREDARNRTPALVFCFNRDECWEVAERLKGLSLIEPGVRAQVETLLDERREDMADGVGPKLRQMLIRGVGVHHAGVLPKHKSVVETLFQRKLVPFVICTETLAAGINLPARSVVLSTLLKGKPREKKLIPASTAHQMFGRAGRPQFDDRGFVYALAHEDDVRIHKWKQRMDRIDPNSKDPGLMRARRELERKRPTRRSTEQYWTQGQFRTLIEAGPAKLYSRSMIPYSVLIFLLMRNGVLHEARELLAKRFNTPDRLARFQEQLDFMLANLAALGYLTRSEDGDHVTLHDTIRRLPTFRSIDPLYGDFLVQQLTRAGFEEKVLALESILQMPPAVERKLRIPDTLAPGPLEREVLAPMMIAMGVTAAPAESTDDEDAWEEEEFPPRPPSFPEMLRIAFEARLAGPEPLFVQPKWVGGAAFEGGCDFFRFVRSVDLIKQEGLVLRHLLRLVILAGEFFSLSQDPDYERISELAARTCRTVEPQYTERFLADAAARSAVESVPSVR